MNSFHQPHSENHITSTRQLHEKKKRVQEKSDFCFYGFMISGVTGLFLWWGSHAFFSVFTQQFTPEEIQGAAKNVISLWNVLMYFVPGIFFSISFGCGVVGFVAVVFTELLYQGELLIIRRKRQKHAYRHPGTAAGDKGETDA